MHSNVPSQSHSMKYECAVLFGGRSFGSACHWHRYLTLAGRTAAETISVMLAVFARVEPALRKSVTFDNDTAFAQHALLRTMRADDVGYLSHK
jgi:hypothetical protein